MSLLRGHSLAPVLATPGELFGGDATRSACCCSSVPLEMRAAHGVGEPEVTLVSVIDAQVHNNSSHTVRNVTCRVPQLSDEPIKLSDVLQPGDRARQAIQVHKPFKVHNDHNELYESARFTFTLADVRWSARYAQPAERLDP